MTKEEDNYESFGQHLFAGPASSGDAKGRAEKAQLGAESAAGTSAQHPKRRDKARLALAICIPTVLVLALAAVLVGSGSASYDANAKDYAAASEQAQTAYQAYEADVAALPEKAKAHIEGPLAQLAKAVAAPEGLVSAEANAEVADLSRQLSGKKVSDYENVAPVDAPELGEGVNPDGMSLFAKAFESGKVAEQATRAQSELERIAEASKGVGSAISQEDASIAGAIEPAAQAGIEKQGPWKEAYFKGDAAAFDKTAEDLRATLVPEEKSDAQKTTLMAAHVAYIDAGVALQQAHDAQVAAEAAADQARIEAEAAAAAAAQAPAQQWSPPTNRGGGGYQLPRDNGGGGGGGGYSGGGGDIGGKNGGGSGTGCWAANCAV